LNILLITDFYKIDSGVSNFINLFKDYLTSNNNNVTLLLFSKTDCTINFDSKFEFDHIYINAHFSNIDQYFIKNGRKGIQNLLNINLNNSNIIIISHGWNKIRFNLSIYYIFYTLKSYNSSLERIKQYDSIMFINDSIDNYRHLDYKFVINNNLNFLYFNFSNFYIKKHRNNNNFTFNQIDFKNKIKILIIANPDYVKNLNFLIMFAIKNLINKKKREINLLSTRTDNLYFKILFYCLNILNINIIYNQNYKYSLLHECSYLFIPSYTEYLPIVSLEAFSFNKHVVSLNKITSLSNFKYYHYLMK
jgi:hypothetical protein